MTEARIHLFPGYSGWRSFSGVPLHGRNAVRFLYLDEAGISLEPIVTVAGPIVHADSQMMELERHLDTLRNKHIHPEHRENFVFHAKQIFNGGGIFRRPKGDQLKENEYSTEMRYAIADDLAKIPIEFTIPIVCASLFKKEVLEEANKQYKRKEITKKRAQSIPHIMAYMLALNYAELWMRQHADTEICTIVAEDNNSKNAIIEIQQLHQNQELINKISPDHFLYPLRKIKHDPFFEKKKPSSILQIADFCSYVMRRDAEGDVFYKKWSNILGERVIKMKTQEEIDLTITNNNLHSFLA